MKCFFQFFSEKISEKLSGFFQLSRKNSEKAVNKFAAYFAKIICVNVKCFSFAAVHSAKNSAFAVLFLP